MGNSILHIIKDEKFFDDILELYDNISEISNTYLLIVEEQNYRGREFNLLYQIFYWLNFSKTYTTEKNKKNTFQNWLYDTCFGMWMGFNS